MKNHTNHTFTFSAILTLLMMCAQLSAQNIDWVLEPIITDADRIDIEESIQLDGIKLIKVKNGDKWGVKDINDNVILPIRYDQASIWVNGNYAQGRMNRDVNSYFVDNEGYEVDYNTEVSPASSKWQKDTKKFDRIENIKKTIIQKYQGYSYDKIDNKRVLLSTITNQVVITDVDHQQLYGINEKMIGHNANRKAEIYDNTGKLLRAWTSPSKISKVIKDRIIVKEGDKYGLYDLDMNNILPHVYDNLYKLDEEYLGAEQGGTYALIGLDGIVIESNLSKVKKIRSNGCIYTTDKMGKSKFYQDGSTIACQVDGKLKRGELGDLIKITNSDTLSGMVSIKTGKLEVPMKYRFLEVAGGVVLADNIPSILQKLRNGKFKRRRPTFGLKDVYNKEGQLILTDSILTAQYIGKNTFKVSNKTRINDKIYNLKDGTLLKTLDETERIAVSPGGFVSISTMDKAAFKKFDSWEDFLLEKTEYSAILEEVTNRETSKKYYHAVQNSKEGIIDEDGNIVVPFTLDKIDFNQYRQYLPAMYKGKWGVIKNPVRS